MVMHAFHNRFLTVHFGIGAVNEQMNRQRKLAKTRLHRNLSLAIAASASAWTISHSRMVENLTLNVNPSETMLLLFFLSTKIESTGAMHSLAENNNRL